MIHFNFSYLPEDFVGIQFHHYENFVFIMNYICRTYRLDCHCTELRTHLPPSLPPFSPFSLYNKSLFPCDLFKKSRNNFKASLREKVEHRPCEVGRVKWRLSGFATDPLLGASASSGFVSCSGSASISSSDAAMLALCWQLAPGLHLSARLRYL